MPVSGARRPPRGSSEVHQRQLKGMTGHMRASFCFAMLPVPSWAKASPYIVETSGSFPRHQCPLPKPGSPVRTKVPSNQPASPSLKDSVAVLHSWIAAVNAFNNLRFFRTTQFSTVELAEGLQRLSWIHLERMQMGMAQLTFITLCKVAGDFKACSWPALTILQLWKLADIEDDDIQALLHPIRSLETLFVAKCPRLTPKVFRHIKIQRSSLLELSFSSHNEEFKASAAMDAQEDYFADYRKLGKASLDGLDSIGPLLQSLPSSLKSLELSRSALSPSWVIVSLQHLHSWRPASKQDEATVPFKLFLKDMIDWEDVDFAAVKVRLFWSHERSQIQSPAISSNLGHGRHCHASLSSSAAILSLCHFPSILFSTFSSQFFRPVST
jgi:hypothetical protein